MKKHNNPKCVCTEQWAAKCVKQKLTKLKEEIEIFMIISADFDISPSVKKWEEVKQDLGELNNAISQ